MKLACTLQVTAGVTAPSGAMPPSRASAASRGVEAPRCRGDSPTTIIANTGFKLSLPSLFNPILCRAPNRLGAPFQRRGCL